jgi:hypothetical protein
MLESFDVIFAIGKTAGEQQQDRKPNSADSDRL